MGTQSTHLGQSDLHSETSYGRQIVPASIPFSGPPATAAVTRRRVWADSRVKRFFDVSIASFGVLLLLPLLGAIALLVKLTSPGPVFFRQQRVGKAQTPFTIYKYRTMYMASGAEQMGSSVTRCGDHRLTRVGSFLRRFKLDELPQLFNVIRGDMSLVGPRPKLPEHERMKMICRPGITGAATIVFAREQSLLKTVPQESFEHFTMNVLNEIKAKIDTDYAQTCTFRSDLGIILATTSGLGRRKPARSIAEVLALYGPPSLPVVKPTSSEQWIN